MPHFCDFRKAVLAEASTIEMKRKNSPPVSAEMAALIKHLVERVGLYQHQVAPLLGLNQGRVSEVMTGKRHPGVKPDQGSFDF